MEQVTIYRTTQGLEFDDPLQAQLAEDILSALDRFFDAREQPASPQSSESLRPLNALKAAKGLKGLSNRALAQRAGVSPGMVSDVLRGKVPLTEAMQRKLEDALRDNHVDKQGE